MSKPIVAIVGRPNVGKSTLFNTLIGEKIAIVEDTPGVTRDRIYGEITWLDRQFALIDTGGIEPNTSDVMLSHMREQAEIAIDTADVIIFITDVRTGVTDADYSVADMLRKSGKPVVLVVNKVDNFEKFSNDVYEFYNLGIGLLLNLRYLNMSSQSHNLIFLHFVLKILRQNLHCVLQLLCFLGLLKILTFLEILVLLFLHLLPFHL